MTTTTAPAADPAHSWMTTFHALWVDASPEVLRAAREYVPLMASPEEAVRDLSGPTGPARIVITGTDARDIHRHVNAYIRPLGGQWVEVQTMRECQHGCKLHVRQRGAIRQYALLHYAGYGCKLGRDESTRTVPVSVRPSA